ncbi:TetR/AcrR family transcriptional regulator [Spongiibacter sp. KMU-158]|uniref:TetR/AcrR family transcriptional regulator n=1 Tax=Spongiibacter pelagi TaxID=2760804 RepID=A0A927C3C3_9GAMM|nr:TetR/AcrR family transcriptional regulator [Spongiibacter pelagi]MBD2859062.1 TetR/AcrR family transcriptional regulator [Spongiibacter pelagi]
MNSASPSPKRGRSKSEEKRCQIIDSAAKLFLEQGFENVSMDNIARLAGVSKQTVYSHFGTKEQLFSSAIESVVEEYELGPSMNRSSDPEAYLRSFCVHLAQLLVSEEALGVHKVCVADAGRSNVAQLFWEAGPSKIRKQLLDFLQQQSEAGWLDIGDHDTACTQMIALLHGEQHNCAILGLNTTSSNENQKDKIERYAQSCVDVFLRAYRRN